jgi:hypothetical protein
VERRFDRFSSTTGGNGGGAAFRLGLGIGRGTGAAVGTERITTFGVSSTNSSHSNCTGIVSRRCPDSTRAGAELFARDFAVSFAAGSGHASSISVVCGAVRGGLLDFFGRGGGFGGTGPRITQMAARDSLMRELALGRGSGKLD